MVSGALSPRGKAAGMLLGIAIKKTYDERWQDDKDGLKFTCIAEKVMDITGDIAISRIYEAVIKYLVRTLEGFGVKGAAVNRYLATPKTLMRNWQQPWERIRLKKESKERIRVTLCANISETTTVRGVAECVLVTA